MEEKNVKKILSRDLLELGFFSALGTVQFSKVGSLGGFVKTGVVNTYDYNNGVYVIYDEKGLPWVKHYENLGADGEVVFLIRKYDLRCGASVPHSNDGGWFMLKVLPTLFSGQEDSTHKILLTSRKEAK